MKRVLQHHLISLNISVLNIGCGYSIVNMVVFCSVLLEPRMILVSNQKVNIYNQGFARYRNINLRTEKLSGGTS